MTVALVRIEEPAHPSVVRRGVAGLALLAALNGPRARACSEGTGGGSPFVVAPVDHESDVPLNVVVSVQWKDAPFDGYDIAGSFGLRTADGAAVAVTVSVGDAWGFSYGTTRTVRLEPTAPLEPQTTYLVMGVPRFDKPQVAIAEFTTGSATLAETPAAGPATLVLDPAFECTFKILPDLQCCGQFPIQRGRIELPTAMAHPVVYTAREGTTLLAQDSPAPLGVLVHCGTYGDFEFPGAQPMPIFIGPGPHTLTFVARDRAGNESAPITLTFTPDCALPAPDAGVPDAGGPDAAPAGPASASGCAVGPRGGTPVWLLVLLLALRRAREPSMKS